MSALNQPQFKTPENARKYLEAVRWPQGPVCPHCGSISKDHYRLEGEAHRDGLWKCKDCREQFTVTVGTVFERSKIALNVWLQAVYLLCSSKKGMSSHQLHRILGVTYKTAWFMTHRIREAMTQGTFGPIGGSGKIVEADETYWGSEDGKKRGKRGGALKTMNKIVTLVERGGKDEQVNHSIGEYVRGVAHTNTVEGYFSVLKRGLIGTYHHVASAHLHRYTNEFDFRYNHRTALGYTDNERTNIVLKEIAGKRLTYRSINATA